MRGKLQALKNKLFAGFHLHKPTYHLGKNKSVDWFLILLGFTIFAGLAALFSYSSFHVSPDATGEGDSSTLTSISHDEISRVLIDRVTTYYDARHTAFTKILETPASLVDPSK